MAIAERLAQRSPIYYGWIVLAAAGSSQVVRNAAASLTIAVFMFPLAEELGWSRTLIAGAASLGGLAATGASPMVGWLVDKYGARLVLAVSIFVLGLSTISLSWATVPIAFYLAYATGRVIFSSPIQIGASVVVSRWFIKTRGRANGLLSLSHSIGMVGFPIIASLVIASQGWRTAWVVLGVLVWVIALAPVSLLIVQRPEDVGLLPDGDKPGTGATDGSARAVEEPQWTSKEAMRTSALWILAIGVGLLFVMQAGTNVHMAAYFRDQGLTTSVAGLALSFNAGFMGVGSIIWGWLIDRVPVRITLAGVALIMAMASIMLVTADTTVEALAYSGLFGFGLGGMLVAPPVAYANYFGRRSLGVIRGVTEPFTSLGQAIGALLSGAIFDITGSYLIAFVTFAVLGVLTMVIVMLAKPPRHASESIVAPQIT
ncbi:MAG: MFS transporter [Chloroflexi bacterium]|nr:MFS transporter [Chloroflexota bacterium]MDA1226970.1 MFS transporter [Chloroflexota bacterium]